MQTKMTHFDVDARLSQTIADRRLSSAAGSAFPRLFRFSDGDVLVCIGRGAIN